MYANVLEYLEAAAVNWPERIAFEDEKEALTYPALMEAAKRVGTGVAAHAALRQPVAVVMTDLSVRCVAGMRGVAYAGCPPAPSSVTKAPAPAWKRLAGPARC